MASNAWLMRDMHFSCPKRAMMACRSGVFLRPVSAARKRVPSLVGGNSRVRQSLPDGNSLRQAHLALLFTISARRKVMSWSIIINNWQRNGHARRTPRIRLVVPKVIRNIRYTAVCFWAIIQPCEKRVPEADFRVKVIYSFIPCLYHGVGSICQRCNRNKQNQLY